MGGGMDQGPRAEKPGPAGLTEGLGSGQLCGDDHRAAPEMFSPASQPGS